MVNFLRLNKNRGLIKPEEVYEIPVNRYADYVKNENTKVKNFLMYLKDNGKILYIATHNFKPSNYLNQINIPPLLFNGIIKETRDVHPSLNSITEYTSKKDMILEIMEKEMCDISEIIFFDDHNYNISQVESINVKSIKVDPIKGIDFSINYNQI